MRKRAALLAFAIGFLAPASGLADVGIPMLVFVWPASWLLLIPVIGVEAICARKIMLASWKDSLKVSAVANAVSTLLGIPLTWAALVFVFAIFAFLADKILPDQATMIVALPLYSTWLPPVRNSLGWLVPAAAAILCIPFFFTSVWLERKIARRMLRDVSADTIRLWSWRANQWTYAPIFVGLVIMALFVGLR
jgi:hypothetical protein